MKTVKMMLVLATTMMAATACGPKKEATANDNEEAKLVLYYSQTSNTKTVAQEIATRLGADIEEIIPLKPYEGDLQATVERCKQEREEGITPEIQPLTSDLSQYDVIFLGYPIWFGTYAPPVAALLDQVDLSGKKVVPFCTFGSGGLVSSIKDLTGKEPEAEILPGYGVRAARLEAVPYEVDQWLKRLGFLEGEYTKLDEFPEQHPVSDEEAAVFDAAVNGYPMLHAKAETVASRAIPDGVEYLFVAEDTGETAPQTRIQVYVTVKTGEAPVFTQVVR